jgi:hypothetical protein
MKVKIYLYIFTALLLSGLYPYSYFPFSYFFSIFHKILGLIFIVMIVIILVFDLKFFVSQIFALSVYYFIIEIILLLVLCGSGIYLLLPFSLKDANITAIFLIIHSSFSLFLIVFITVVKLLAITQNIGEETTNKRR